MQTLKPYILRQLTEKQLALILFIRGELTNTEIAEYLHVKECTIKDSVSRLLRKFGVRSRKELADLEIIHTKWHYKARRKWRVHYGLRRLAAEENPALSLAV
jgi:DNA-binding CsgD family transcriptional regulator